MTTGRRHEPLFVPGSPIPLEDMRAIGDAALAAGMADGWGGPPSSAAGTYLVEPTPRFEFWARLTAFSTPYYSFKEVYWSGTAWLDRVNGVTGELNAKELNDTEGIPVGDTDGRVVWMTLADVSAESGSPFLFGYDHRLTVQEADGSPSYTGVTVLEFSQAKHFVVSQWPDGRVLVSQKTLTLKQSDLGGVGLGDTLEITVDADAGLRVTSGGDTKVNLTVADAAEDAAGVVSLTDQQLGLGYKAVKGLVLDEGDLSDGSRPCLLAGPLTDLSIYPATFIGTWDPAGMGGGTVSKLKSPLLVHSVILGDPETTPVTTSESVVLTTTGTTLVARYYLSSVAPLSTGGTLFSCGKVGGGLGPTTIFLSLPGDDDQFIVGSYYGQTGTYGGLDFRGGILVGGSFSGSGVTSVDVSGGSTGLTFSGGPVTSSGSITLAGTLGAANGGTGLTTTPPAGSVLTGDGTGYTQSRAATHAYLWGVD